MDHHANEDIVISSDKSRLDRELIHAVLATTYWSKGIPRDVVERAIEGSLCFGVYKAGAQIGFARLITDQATFAYLADVFIVEAEQRKGYGKALIAHVTDALGPLRLRRTLLATADAHGLYRQYGFTPLGKPDTFMEINVKDIYQQGKAGTS
ncbi:GNAT family N-acetyltransferase [Sorangium cellulosum]|uniref:GNAT family acetyltransferase n=1 Tax=Sorangium cellulosum TaxID=56 RepID=A0A150QN50_SORCE|nr:GNAT family N-acetyltransferase [Sorangium cellulosum]KYF69399.1 GNAT family acetyltransferase [Sorangium cellulosum]